VLAKERRLPVERLNELGLTLRFGRNGGFSRSLGSLFRGI